MRNRTAAAVATAALVLGAGAGVAVAASYDHDGWPRHGAMMAGSWGGPMGHRDSPDRDVRPGHRMGVVDEHEFLVEMIAHHEEAIDAAGQLSRSDRAVMRRFGRRIVESQSAQVEQMERWLAEWYPDRSTEDDYQPMMRELDGLSGDELDRVFLEDMIGHHMGAVMMSRQLLVADLADHDVVADLARDIVDEQHREIVDMQDWLGDWFGVDWHGAGMHGNGTMGPGVMGPGMHGNGMHGMFGGGRR